ncbi:DUF1868 domain-containing protein [Vibrio lentus]|nr:DUF1868 domain-containing protein [Vibrio lentus]
MTRLELRWAQDQLKSMNCGDKFSFLPISSITHDNFEGVCDQEFVKRIEKWTSKLDLAADLSETTDLFATEASKVKGGFEMMYDYV